MKKKQENGASGKNAVSKSANDVMPNTRFAELAKRARDPSIGQSDTSFELDADDQRHRAVEQRRGKKKFRLVTASFVTRR